MARFIACKSGNISISAPHSQLIIGKHSFKCLSDSAFSRSKRSAIFDSLVATVCLIERLLGKPTEIRATPISDALSLLVAEEKNKSDERLTGMRSSVLRLSLKDWKQPLLGEASVYILIAEKKAILAKTSDLIKNSRKEVVLIATEGESFLFYLSFRMNAGKQ